MSSNGSASVTSTHGDGAYSAILNDRLGRFTIKHLHGDGEADCKPAIGTFYEPEDSRLNLSFKKATLLLNKTLLSVSIPPL
jgi:hypothetical protein